MTAFNRNFGGSSGGGLELFRQQGRAKGGLADKVVCRHALQRFCHQRIQGVPLAAGDAVGYREMTTLVGLQIVVRVSILCDKDLLRAVGADLFHREKAWYTENDNSEFD